MIETVTFHPNPDQYPKANKREWTPTKFLAVGEYDLVNISLIGYDPNSGWSYEQCQDAWDKAFAEAQAEEKTIALVAVHPALSLQLRVNALAQRQWNGV